jgi:biotin carboxylase
MAAIESEGPMPESTERILCLASEERGQEFLRQCAEMGVRPNLLTLERLRDADWPRDVLEDITTMPSGLNREQILNTVSWMARSRNYDRVVALDEDDLETAAQLREHMRIPGMGTTTAGCYRDKLAMRVIARAFGYPVPEFCRVLNYDELREYVRRVRPPWLLRPRAEASAVGIRRIDDQEQLWRVLDDLGDLQSHHILDEFVAGDLFHVDSIVSEREVKFSVVHQYGRPPMNLMHGGGIFATQTVDRASLDWKELTAKNRGIAPMLGMVRGLAHAEFVRSHANGTFYFLEVAANISNSLIPDVVKAASGINLMREWARLEVADLRGQTYELPEAIESYAGLVQCLSLAGEPQTDGFDDVEIIARIKKPHQAGLIVRSDRPQRVKQMLDGYSQRFTDQLMMHGPERPALDDPRGF